MKKIITLFSLTVLVGGSSLAQNNVLFSAADNWIAYMNVFDKPADGGAYQFGSPWALADVKSTPDVLANTMTLQPNFGLYAADPSDPYWVDQTTMEGNKDCEASTFVEPGAAFNGVDLTFHGDVLAYTLDSNYTAQFFIKALDSTNGYSDALGGAMVFNLPTSGDFTASVTAAQIPVGLIVQYGFTVRGTNANPLDEATLGSVVIGVDFTSIEEYDNTSITLAPNPTNDILNVTSDEKIVSYSVINLAGQTVLSGSQNGAIEVSGLEAGSYFVRVQFENGATTKPFIKY